MHCAIDSPSDCQMILSAKAGTNADLMADILSLYVPEGATIADVTYGRGVFWRKVDISKYVTKFTDLQAGTDLRALPYPNGSIDCVFLDPPYMHGGSTIKASINRCYRNCNDGHESVIRLYTGGVLEAARVLRKGGILVVKTQDEIESGQQRFSHVELITILELLGYRVLDLFVLVQAGKPALQVKAQKSARKNHSYALVARLRR